MMISAILFSAVMSMTSCSMVPAVPPTPENTVIVGDNYMQIGKDYSYSFIVTISPSKEDNRLQEGTGATILDLYTGGFVTAGELKFWQDAGRQVRDNINAKLDALYDANHIGYTYTFTGICQPNEDGVILAVTWNPF